jgi:hypothetical protein
MSETRIRPAKGQSVVDIEGNAVGEISAIYEDEMTGAPEWLQVRANGLNVMVPLESATEQSHNLRVPYFGDQIREAPQIDAEADCLDHALEMQMYEHYHVLRILPGDVEERERRNATNPATWQQRLRRAA